MARPARARIRFYTSNPGKLSEARAVLAPAGWYVLQGRRRLVEPQADTLEEVARAKLAQVPLNEGAAMVEDAGLFVRSLRGFPGVYSAYVLRTLGTRGLVRLVDGEDRSATFRAVVGLRLRGRPHLFVGEARGSISDGPRGRKGFGFDPVFVPEGEHRTFAELSPEEKLAISHRGRAMARLVRFLGSKT